MLFNSLTVLTLSLPLVNPNCVWSLGNSLGALQNNIKIQDFIEPQKWEESWAFCVNALEDEILHLQNTKAVLLSSGNNR